MLGGDAQLSVKLDAAREYLLEATGLHGQRGKYTLDVLRGRADERTEEEKTRLEQQDLREKERFLAEWKGPEDRTLLRVVESLAWIRGIYGHSQQAVDLSRRALKIRELIWGPESLAVAEGLQTLATQLENLERPVKAVSLVERSLEIYRALGPDTIGAANAEVRLASLLTTLRDFERAEPLLEHALATVEQRLGPDDARFGTVLGALTRLNDARGDYAAAIRFCARMLAIQRRYVGMQRGSSGFGAWTLYRLMSLYFNMGDHDSARAHGEEALELFEDEYGPDTVAVASGRRRLATVLDAQGEYEAAYKLWRSAHSSYQAALGLNDVATAESLSDGARLLLNLGRHEEAIEHAWQALERTAEYEGRVLAAIPESHRMRRLDRGLRGVATLLSAGREVEAVGRDPYLQALRWKGRVSRSLVQSRGRALRDMDGVTRAHVEQLRDVQAMLSATFFASEAISPEEQEVRLARLRARRVELETALTQAAGAQGKDTIASVAQVSSSLPADTVLIDFLSCKRFVPAQRNEQGEVAELGGWVDAELSAWVLRSDDKRARRVELGAIGQINAAVKEFLDILVSGPSVSGRGVTIIGAPSGVEAFAGANARLRALIWDPLEKHVGEAKRVVVSPFGSIGTLPFGVLQLDDGTHLIEHHAFVYVQDAASLINLTTERTATSAGGLITVGGVDYDNASEEEEVVPDPGELDLLATADAGTVRGSFDGSWQQLRFTSEEVVAVAELYAAAADKKETPTLLAHSAATEKTLKQALPGHRYVHVATHGFFQPAAAPSMWEEVQGEDGVEPRMRTQASAVVGLFPGLLSGLVCAGANRPPQSGREDGLLTAEEVTWLDLSGCELVTLSACQTALGTSRGGEGLVGLRRSFRLAGARTVVASLWSVGDEETSVLMRSFYRYLWLEGRSKGDALRAAQLDMLRRNRIANGGRTRPVTWGAFVLSGDWR